MSGHSKWATTKHKKALIDAKRGKVFTKLIRELTMAARQGGDPQANPRLRTAILKAKESNMPSDNIDRAVKKGTGELPGQVIEEIAYEGYGPNGVAIIIEAMTDNKNRTTSEIRNILSKRGGNLAGSGSVSWIFHKKGYILVDKKSADEDKVMSVALDSGAEDFAVSEESYEITTTPHDFEKVKTALSDNKIQWTGAEITMLPTSSVKLDKDNAKKTLDLIEELEDHDDVQHVYANFDIPDSVMKEIEGK